MGMYEQVAMAGLAKTLGVVLAACIMASDAAAYAAESAPLGAWRTTNGCFLVAFILSEGGRAQAAYMTGEQDDNAAWNWDGTTLTITSRMFDLDTFAGRLANDQLQADYVWHNLDNNQLNRQACVFERFTPFGI